MLDQGLLGLGTWVGVWWERGWDLMYWYSTCSIFEHFRYPACFVYLDLF